MDMWIGLGIVGLAAVWMLNKPATAVVPTQGGVNTGAIAGAGIAAGLGWLASLGQGGKYTGGGTNGDNGSLGPNSGGGGSYGGGTSVGIGGLAPGDTIADPNGNGTVDGPPNPNSDQTSSGDGSYDPNTFWA